MDYREESLLYSQCRAMCNSTGMVTVRYKVVSWTGDTSTFIAQEVPGSIPGRVLGKFFK